MTVLALELELSSALSNKRPHRADKDREHCITADVGALAGSTQAEESGAALRIDILHAAPAADVRDAPDSRQLGRPCGGEWRWPTRAVLLPREAVAEIAAQARRPPG